MIVSTHPASTGGAYRGRHDTRGGERWTRAQRKTGDAAADERNRVVLISRRWDQVLRATIRKATEANKPGLRGERV